MAAGHCTIYVYSSLFFQKPGLGFAFFSLRLLWTLNEFCVDFLPNTFYKFLNQCGLSWQWYLIVDDIVKCSLKEFQNEC